MIYHFQKWRNDTAQKEYRAVIQNLWNLKSGYFRRTPLLRTLAVRDTKWRPGALSSAEAPFALGRVGSLKAGERVKESARRTLGSGKREERPFRLLFIPIACVAAGRGHSKPLFSPSAQRLPKACSDIPQVCRDICIRFWLAGFLTRFVIGHLFTQQITQCLK